MKAIECAHPPHHCNCFVATWLCFTYLTLRFSKKEQSFKENWMSVSKPKTAGVKDHDQQENNIQYGTYYRNKYTRVKIKKKHLHI